MDLYSSIYDFCSVRNNGCASENGLNKPNRVKYLIELLISLRIPYELDEYVDIERGNNHFFNIYLKGTSPYFIVAHHDVLNINTDNANDNSASVINCIVYKLMNPSINVGILDAEEPPCMGRGSQRLSELINKGKFGEIKGVVNLELTGKGGSNFFIGNHKNSLFNKVIELFPDVFVFNTPFSDTETFIRNNIQSVVLTCVPTESIGIVNEKRVIENHQFLYNCHSHKDTLSSISIEDMKDFNENVLDKIIKNL